MGGLPPEMHDFELKEFFLQFGSVSKAYTVKVNGKCYNRGFGFVVFDDEVVFQQLVKIGRVLYKNGTQFEIRIAGQSLESTEYNDKSASNRQNHDEAGTHQQTCSFIGRNQNNDQITDEKLSRPQKYPLQISYQSNAHSDIPIFGSNRLRKRKDRVEHCLGDYPEDPQITFEEETTNARTDFEKLLIQLPMQEIIRSIIIRSKSLSC